MKEEPKYFSGEGAMGKIIPDMSAQVILAGLAVLGIATALFIFRRHTMPWLKKRLAALQSLEKVMEGRWFHRRLADFLPRFGTKRRLQYKTPKRVVLTPKKDPYLKSLIDRVNTATQHGKKRAIIHISAHEASSWHIPARLQFLPRYTRCVVNLVPKSDGSVVLHCIPEKEARE